MSWFAMFGWGYRAVERLRHQRKKGAQVGWGRVTATKGPTKPEVRRCGGAARRAHGHTRKGSMKKIQPKNSISEWLSSAP